MLTRGAPLDRYVRREATARDCGWQFPVKPGGVETPPTTVPVDVMHLFCTVPLWGTIVAGRYSLGPAHCLYDASIHHLSQVRRRGDQTRTDISAVGVELYKALMGSS